MTTQSPIQTVTVDGIAHEVSALPENIQQAVAVYNTFSGQLQEEQLAVLKTQSAMQHLGAQITEAIRKATEASKAANDETPAAE